MIIDIDLVASFTYTSPAVRQILVLIQHIAKSWVDERVSQKVGTAEGKRQSSALKSPKHATWQHWRNSNEADESSAEKKWIKRRRRIKRSKAEARQTWQHNRNVWRPTRKGDSTLIVPPAIEEWRAVAEAVDSATYQPADELQRSGFTIVFVDGQVSQQSGQWAFGIASVNHNCQSNPLIITVKAIR